MEEKNDLQVGEVNDKLIFLTVFTTSVFRKAERSEYQWNN